MNSSRPTVAKMVAGRELRAGRRLLAVGVTVLLALALAFGARGATGGQVEVMSIYPEGSPDYTYLTSLNRSFEATHPGTKASLVVASLPDYANIVARWRAGNPPEVNVGFFGPSENEQAYQRAGLVYDLTNAMNQPIGGGYGRRRSGRTRSSRPSSPQSH